MPGRAAKAGQEAKKTGIFGLRCAVFRKDRRHKHGQSPSKGGTKVSGSVSSAAPLVNLPVLGQNACFFAVQH